MEMILDVEGGAEVLHELEVLDKSESFAGVRYLLSVYGHADVLRLRLPSSATGTAWRGTRLSGSGAVSDIECRSARRPCD